MEPLFTPSKINKLNLKNRIIRSATWEGMCDENGKPSFKLIDYYRELAKGGTGLIISGYTFVRKDGKQLNGKMGIDTDEFENEFKKLTKAVHEQDSKIAIQLVHAGGQTDSKTISSLAPSSIKHPQFPKIPKELSIEQIKDIVQAFANSAFRAKQWGFDAVQIHGAHGYLINQFLSSALNKRADKYGSQNLENKSRFLFEVYDAIRSKVGNDYPVFIKLNGDDWIENGFNINEAIKVAKQLSKKGINAIVVSSGTAVSKDLSPVRTKINTDEKQAYNLDLAFKIKQVVDCPIISVGGFKSFEIAQNALKEKKADFVAFSRPLICEPDLANRWQYHDKSPSKCISCNKCFMPGITEGGIYCVVQKRIKEKASQQ